MLVTNLIQITVQIASWLSQVTTSSYKTWDQAPNRTFVPLPHTMKGQLPMNSTNGMKRSASTFDALTNTSTHIIVSAKIPVTPKALKLVTLLTTMSQQSFWHILIRITSSFGISSPQCLKREQLNIQLSWYSVDTVMKHCMTSLQNHTQELLKNQLNFPSPSTTKQTITLGVLQ